ncbi:ATPase [Limnohabitans sp. INBF002]|nr:ATPase [Limnohabitans sp. INBF002]
MARDGANALEAAQRRTVWGRLWAMLREPMFALLVLAASLYLVLGDLTEGLTLFVFVLAVLALTFYQEGKSEAAIDALRQLSQPFAQVMRDGQRINVPSSDVVVGDMLFISEGDRIAADAWVLQADQLQVDESLLTGESLAVTKVGAAFDEALVHGQQPGGDELAAVFGGTFVVRGQGVVRVTATGMRGQMGRIGASLNQIETALTPLQKQTAQLVKVLAWITFGLCVLMILTLGLRNGAWLPALLSGIALAMAILPEEYPVVMAIFPALGAHRLAQEGVLTRHINAIETLGATTVLCTDKTGTLTENRMKVAALAVGEASTPRLFNINGESLPDDFHGLVEHAILASAPEPFDPMEVAFHALGQTWLHDEHLHPDWDLVQTYALSPALRAMSHVWRASEDAAHIVSAKGAPEAVMDLCHLSPALQAQWGEVVHAMASEGLRVLAVAQGRFVGDAWPSSAHGFDFEWLGLIGLSDPLRAEIPQAIADCHSASIKVIMITGDYPQTARVIANQAGLQGGETLTGDTIDAMSDEALSAHLKTVSVCARISPHQKLRIVQALKRSGEVVAMTGDGVNDAPALRAAHVGIAMGARGTDVAREASSLVLVDDNFASIVKGIRLGRRIFGNLQKSMAYIFAIHIPIAGLALVPMLFALPPLLMPLHIALLELVVDPSCSIAFENEPAEADVMQRPPRDTLAPIFGFQQMLASFFQGACVLVATGAAYWVSLDFSAEAQRAMVLITLVAANAMLIFVNRARNWVAVWVMVAALTLVLFGIYVPWLAAPLNLAPLDVSQLATALGLGAASVLAAWFCLGLLRYDGPFKGAEHG